MPRIRARGSIVGAVGASVKGCALPAASGAASPESKCATARCRAAAGRQLPGADGLRLKRRVGNVCGKRNSWGRHSGRTAAIPAARKVTIWNLEPRRRLNLCGFRDSSVHRLRVKPRGSSDGGEAPPQWTGNPPPTIWGWLAQVATGLPRELDLHRWVQDLGPGASRLPRPVGSCDIIWHRGL